MPRRLARSLGWVGLWIGLGFVVMWLIDQTHLGYWVLLILLVAASLALPSWLVRAGFVRADPLFFWSHTGLNLLVLGLGLGTVAEGGDWTVLAALGTAAWAWSMVFLWSPTRHSGSVCGAPGPATSSAGASGPRFRLATS